MDKGKKPTNASDPLSVTENQRYYINMSTILN